MQTPTKTIECPISKAKIELKEWITGRDREYINEPLYGAVQTRPTMVGGKPDVAFGNIDVKSFVNESAHREIEKFVVSVNGSKEKILDTILNMHEDDTAFVKAEIDKVAKKNGTPKL